MKVQSLRKTISEKRQQGFTLVEILVVIGILAVLLAVSLVAINPNQHFIDSRNSQRWSNVNAILDAIYEYQASHNGSLPPSVASVSTTAPLAKVATPTNEVDLCSDLAPAIIADLPLDPKTGVTDPTGGTPCAAATDTYDTGYTISKGASNRFTVTAPDAEGGTTISVTR